MNDEMREVSCHTTISVPYNTIPNTLVLVGVNGKAVFKINQENKLEIADDITTKECGEAIAEAFNHIQLGKIKQLQTKLNKAVTIVEDYLDELEQSDNKYCQEKADEIRQTLAEIKESK